MIGAPLTFVNTIEAHPLLSRLSVLQMNSDNLLQFHEMRIEGEDSRTIEMPQVRGAYVAL